MFDYDKLAAAAVETLDEYDFSSVLKSCYGVDILDVCDLLETYGEAVSSALENLSEDEIAIYLTKRYGMKIEEVSRYRMSWNNRWCNTIHDGYGH